jgi:hypothetical protein
MNDFEKEIFFTPPKSPEKEPEIELLMDISYESDIILQLGTKGC